MTRVLITGGGGQLGSDLEEQLRQRAEVRALTRAALDITDEGVVGDVFAQFEPTLVINCAAFHNVEVCEREEDRSFEVNARAVGRLARRCSESGAKLVHLSTNYVFDGTAEGAYTEESMPAPRSIYAISKLAGEHCALAYSSDALVVRTAGLYGLHGSASKGGNFVTRMLARAREQGSLNVVADQRLTPTFTADLSSAILNAVDTRAHGVLHVTNGGETSWHGFTEAFVELTGTDVPVNPVQTIRSPGAADRPLNGVMRSVISERLGLEPMRPWRDALVEYLGCAGLLAAEERPDAADLSTQPLIGA
jgi:dTDP-4-dehydrorhamnose reductase